jgi:D-sedoheptulose 7-phosphate isomerase
MADVNDPRLAAIDRVFADAIRAHDSARRADQGAVVKAVDVITGAFREGRRLLTFGNGGSAADAQHFAAEFVGRFQRERRAAPAIALTTDTSILTAIGNDYGFDRVFARQVEALGESGDVAFGITTSGSSANVIEALRVAQQRGLTTVALTGRDGGRAGKLVDIHLNVADESTARVQEVHRTLLHVICELVEAGL